MNIQGVTKRYGTNFRTHSSHLEGEIMLYEHESGNALFPCSPTLHSTLIDGKYRKRSTSAKNSNK